MPVATSHRFASPICPFAPSRFSSSSHSSRGLLCLRPTPESARFILSPYRLFPRTPTLTILSSSFSHFLTPFLFFPKVLSAVPILLFGRPPRSPILGKPVVDPTRFSIACLFLFLSSRFPCFSSSAFIPHFSIFLLLPLFVFYSHPFLLRLLRFSLLFPPFLSTSTLSHFLSHFPPCSLFSHSSFLSGHSLFAVFCLHSFNLLPTVLTFFLVFSLLAFLRRSLLTVAFSARHQLVSASTSA